MSDEALLTLRQLADELHLPESTARYYRDAFLDHIPSVGTGRRRRYPPEAVAVLRSIASGYSAGATRSAIIASINGGQDAPTPAVRVSAEKATRASQTVEEVTNLDLLAAILDGEREQRDALWQMAKEIVRLTNVLDGQDQVLTEIADRAGIVVSSERRIGGGAAAALNPAREAEPVAAAAPAPAPAIFAEQRGTGNGERGTRASAEVASAARASSGDGDMDRLRAELETERALVERLREAKLQLEHRAADAEAALADQKPKRTSVIGRLLGSDQR